MQFLPNFLRILILLFLTFFAISCAQLQNASEKPDDNKSDKVEVLENKLGREISIYHQEAQS